MQRVLAEVKELGIEVCFLDLKKNGYSLIDLNIIFINQELDEEKAKEVLIHELAHFKLHSDYSSTYRQPIPNMKMEQEAISYAINRIISENDGVYNYTQMVEAFRISMGNDIKYANQ
ncbi:ImmA/IrrE family metallo-endopeptidase [Jeotgalibaca dankookensis]|uniref:ImmA/IrrE family metallo-endopeptidase n=1 Tax=Jeotgalibaca dankookensis TaxID=708126 RepID=UPI0007850B71|nr:ImmA/IrrE family metallo-endopeptidase [Jeotgalibaca dankookensis]